MNLNGDEKRIRQLFRDLVTAERATAPEFEHILSVATARRRPTSRSRSLRFATGLALFSAVLLTSVVIISRQSKNVDTLAEQASAPPIYEEKQNAPPSSIQNAGVQTISPKRTARRHRRPGSDKMSAAMKSIFAWRSPTAALLKTPNEELFRSLPRIGESFRTIKTYSKDQFN